jgi:CRP-like cAMP-binding protein
VSILKEGQRIGLLTAGDCFGEMEATGRSKTTLMRAITDTTLMIFRAPSIEHASVNNQLWFYKLFTHTLLERLSRPVEPLAVIEGQPERLPFRAGRRATAGSKIKKLTVR